jgi:hypothetical protein
VTERTKIVLFCIFVVGASSACKDDGDSPSPTIDAGTALDSGTPAPADAGLPPSDAGLAVAAVAPDCYTSPKSYVEIINACTDAEKVVKNPSLPLLGADGRLPPLP